MKRMWLCIAIIVTLTALALGGFFFIDETTGKMNENINKIEEAYKNGDIEEMSAAADSLGAYWKHFCATQIFTADTERALEITASVARITAFVQTNHEDIPSECAAAKSLLESYRGEQVPNILNIL